MHEFRQAGVLIRKIEEALSEAGGGRLQSIRVRIGPMNEMTPDQLRAHFERVAYGTAAEGVRLEVQVSNNYDFPRGQDVYLESLTLQE